MSKLYVVTKESGDIKAIFKDKTVAEKYIKKREEEIKHAIDLQYGYYILRVVDTDLV